MRIAFLLIAIVLSGNPSLSEWSLFKSRDCGFSIQMPDSVVVEEGVARSVNGDPLPSYTYSSKDEDGSYFTVMCTVDEDMPKISSEKKKQLIEGIPQLSESSIEEVQERTILQVNNGFGLEYVVHESVSNSLIYNRVFIIGDRLVFLVATKGFAAEEGRLSAYDRFFDSFSPES